MTNVRKEPLGVTLSMDTATPLTMARTTSVAATAATPYLLRMV